MISGELVGMRSWFCRPYDGGLLGMVKMFFVGLFQCAGWVTVLKFEISVYWRAAGNGQRS